jgi:hypothetical protein
MSEVKLDAGYDEHPKVVGLSEAAFNMEIRAMCYTSRNSLDGFIPGGWLQRQTSSSEPREVAEELVKATRWHRADVPCPKGHDTTCPTMAGEGWRIHDYLDDNPSSEQVRAKRAAGAARMRRSRKRVRTEGDRSDTAEPAASGQATADSQPASPPTGGDPAGPRPLRPVRDGQT